MAYRVAPVLVLVLASFALAQEDRRAAARPNFLVVEQFARLPAAEQKTGFEKFYRDVAPKHLSSMPLMILSSSPADILDRKKGYARGEGSSTENWIRQIADAAATKSPQEVADLLDDPNWLWIASHLRTLDVLRTHRETTTTLVKNDLNSATLADFKRGCEVIVALQLNEFVPTMLDAYLAGGERAVLAKNAMVWVSDSTVAGRLMKEVERDPKSIARHADLLMQPLSAKPAPKLLLDLLGNPDADIRLGAARALSSARDPAIAEPALQFATKGENPDLQEMGVLLAMELDDGSFRSIADRLVELMWSKNDRIRALAIKAFANRKDARAAEPLLELLERERVATQEQVTLMQALSGLTNGKVRYDMHQWGPEKNAKGIQQFQDWIKAHPVKQ